MYVKPAPGLMLRDPVTKQLLSAAPVEGVKTTVVPDEGMLVDDNDMFWRRRLRDGDAVRASGPKAAASSGNTPAPAVAVAATEKTSS
ncbi:DUF2635 domain-containing protein [Paraburkholderia heleia]|uniref:DUF2635 domain-containing protein n=1 Tax=Paraburkholderia heleia TaxID=634127 RepID=UPI002AB6378B|nr:DUF2635 domain-containing protein [Paraburkholderia heleia]